jgi:AmmeMemoRadiSam system protein B
MATARAARAAAAKGDAKIATANGAEPSYATSTTGRHLAATPTRALIGPHAGYSYCAHVLAHAYAGVEAGRVRRAFVLGPSHHVYSKEATISGVEACATPLGALAVDDPTRAALLATSAFGASTTPLAVDEAEHSLELHLPFLASALGARPGIPASIPIIPIMVGALGPEAEAIVAAALAPYLADPSNLFVVSSDFCHWGSRFGYVRTRAGVDLADSIEALDREGMALIAAQDGPGFRAYLARTGNTVCGRHPISLFLAMLAACGEVEHEVQFVAYDQSSRCAGLQDSSVSYASAVVAVKG